MARVSRSPPRRRAVHGRADIGRCPPRLSRWQARQYEREQTEAAGFTPAGPLQFDHLTVGGDLTVRGVTIQQYCRGHAPPRPGQSQSAGDDREGLGHLDHRRAPALAPAGHPAGAGPDRTPRPGHSCLGPSRPAPGPRRPGAGARDTTRSTCSIAWIARCSSWGRRGRARRRCCSQLARDLLQRAAQDPEQPIPVVFPLSSWAAQRRPLGDWLVDELQQRYDVPRTIGQAWVDADQVLPLLDGLDEVQAEHRAACVERDQYLSAGPRPAAPGRL